MWACHMHGDVWWLELQKMFLNIEWYREFHWRAKIWPVYDLHGIIQPFYGESQRHSIQRAINRTDHGMAMGRILMRTVLWHDASTNTIDTWHKLNFVKWLMSTAVVVPMVSICASSLVGHWLPVPCFIVAFWGWAWRSLNSHLTAFLSQRITH